MNKERKNQHLSEDFINKQEKRLLKKQKELIQQQKELAKFPDIGDSPDDTAQEASEFESNLHIKHNVDKLLSDTQAALKRIEKGTYGIDVKTKEPIEKGRLELMPEASSAAETE